MKDYQTRATSPLDHDGMLSTDFVEQSGLRVRVLAGVPTILELGILSSALGSQAAKATFELYEDGVSLSCSYETEPTVFALVDLMHEKFAKAALVRSGSNPAMAFFDYWDDYFLFLSKSPDIDSALHLNREQMADYFEDTIEYSSDKEHLTSIWVKYERFM